VPNGQSTFCISYARKLVALTSFNTPYLESVPKPYPIDLLSLKKMALLKRKFTPRFLPELNTHSPQRARHLDPSSIKCVVGAKVTDIIYNIYNMSQSALEAAYFSMEIMLETDIPSYAGGRGF
jgi:hypothetical protein